MKLSELAKKPQLVKLTISKQEIVDKLNICILDKIENCKECNYRYFCSHGCPGVDKIFFEDEKYRKELCNYNKIKFHNLI